VHTGHPHHYKPDCSHPAKVTRPLIQRTDSLHLAVAVRATKPAKAEKAAPLKEDDPGYEDVYVIKEDKAVYRQQTHQVQGIGLLCYNDAAKAFIPIRTASETSILSSLPIWAAHENTPVENDGNKASAGGSLPVSEQRRYWAHFTPASFRF